MTLISTKLLDSIKKFSTQLTGIVVVVRFKFLKN